MYDACVLGHVTLDRIRIPGRADREMAGGSALYVSRTWARLGLKVLVVTKVRPEDEAALLDPLRADGIAVLNRGSDATTVFDNAYSGPGLSHRSQRVHSIADPFRPEDLSGVRARCLHVGPLTRAEVPPDLFPAFGHVADRVALDGQGLLREVAGGRVRLTPNPWIDAALAAVDVLKVDDTEAEIMIGRPEPDAAAAALAARGVAEVLLTFADRGSAVRADGAYARVPAIAPPETVDATGCGDTFVAAYLFARERGAAPSEAARFASAAASLKMTSYGPFAGTEADVRAHMG